MAKYPESRVTEARSGSSEEYEMSSKDDGTLADQRDMERVGRKQEFKRNFHTISIVGFTAVLMCTWEATLMLASYIIPNGGLAGMVWMFLISLIGFSFAILSMAEMASMAPTSGGQYFWVSEFSPPSAQKFLSFMTGWLCVLGWQVNIASAGYLVTTQIQGMVSLNNPTYVPQPWHETVMIIAVVIIGLLFNTFCAKKLPMIEGFVLVLHVFGFFAILIPLWVFGPNHSAHEVFTEFTNAYEWQSQGLACLVGIIGPVYTLLGPDSAVHMAEEIRDASRVLPLAMIWTLIINGATGLIMMITFAFCLGDVETALTPSYGFAYIDTFYRSTGSRAGATVMTCILTIMGVCSLISNVATASRQMFAFARDGGLPYSAWLSKVHPAWNVPLNAVMVSFVISCLLALINLGSSVAFNAIISLMVGAVLSSYLISITCVLYRRFRGPPLPPARWSLGRAGAACNFIAICFMAVVYVFSFFPLAPEVDAASMNWSIVMYGGVILFSLAYFAIYARHVYVGPVALVKQA